MAGHRDSWVETVDSLMEERMVVEGIAEEESIEAGIVSQEGLKMGVVVSRAVSKPPWVVCKILVRMIHNPHLVNYYT